MNELTPDELERLATIPVHVSGHLERMTPAGRAALGRLILAAADELGKKE